MDKITTALRKIRACRPCEGSYEDLTTALGADYGEDTPITVMQAYDAVGYERTLWGMRCVDAQHAPLWAHFAIDCAEQVRHQMTDKRSTDALDVARRYLGGGATEDKMKSATSAADSAWAAARAAARAASDNKPAIQKAQIRLLAEYCRLGERPENSAELLAKFIQEEKAK